MVVQGYARTHQRNKIQLHSPQSLCNDVRRTHNNPSSAPMKLTDEQTAAFDAIRREWAKIDAANRLFLFVSFVSRPL